MATIKFHGNLKRFEPEGESLEICAETFQELMSGLLTQIKGLRQYLQQGYYKVRIGSKRYLNEALLKSNTLVALDEDCTVHFTPVVAGAGKNSSLIQVIAGIVIIAASIISYQYYNIPYGTALMMGTMGASMAFSGVVQMLSRPPEMNNKIDDSEKKQSTSFSNLRNLTPQGRPIPLLYGKMMTSLVLISQGVESYDEITEADILKQEEDRKKQEKLVEIASGKESEKARIREERAESARDARERRDNEREEKREKRERRDQEMIESARS